MSFRSWHQPKIAAHAVRGPVLQRACIARQATAQFRRIDFCFRQNLADIRLRRRRYSPSPSPEPHRRRRQMLFTSASPSSALNTTCRTGRSPFEKKTFRTRPRICSLAKSSGFHPSASGAFLSCPVTSARALVRGNRTAPLMTLFPHAESLPRAPRGSDARTGECKYASTSSGVRNAGST